MSDKNKNSTTSNTNVIIGGKIIPLSGTGFVIDGRYIKTEIPSDHNTAYENKCLDNVLYELNTNLTTLITTKTDTLYNKFIESIDKINGDITTINTRLDIIESTIGMDVAELTLSFENNSGLDSNNKTTSTHGKVHIKPTPSLFNNDEVLDYVWEYVKGGTNCKPITEDTTNIATIQHENYSNSNVEVTVKCTMKTKNGVTKSATISFTICGITINSKMALTLSSTVIDENTDTITCTLTNLTSSNYGDLSNNPIKCKWSITAPKNNTIKWSIGGTKHNIDQPQTTDVIDGTTSITINGENISTSVLEKLTITATPIINKDSKAINLSPQKTKDISVGNDLNYYWYAGEVKPVDDASIESSGKTSTAPITTLKITNSNNFQYFAYPKSWGTPTLIDTSNQFEFSINNVSSLETQFDNNPNSKYYCKRIGKNTGDITCSITWK